MAENQTSVLCPRVFPFSIDAFSDGVQEIKKQATKVSSY